MFVYITSCLLLACATGQSMRGGAQNAASELALGNDLITAMDEVLGCGDMKVTPAHLAQIKDDIEIMWSTMPQTNGKLDWKSLRYVAHRYFMQQSSLLIRGLEPSRSLNSSEAGHAHILTQEVPHHAELLFGGKKVDYSRDDAASFLASLEQLVFDSETHLLEKVYGQFGMETTRRLSTKQMQRMLEAYLVNWMISEDEAAVMALLRNRTLLANSFPHWGALKEFVDGRVKLMDFQNVRSLKPGVGLSLMEKRYTFADAHSVVGGITKTFQDFWQSECHTMKDQLVELDRQGTGRVRLSDFYGTGLDKDWRFGESETYLRELGVLDESSPWMGKQVLIPNYLQAASNCIVAAPHYLVCCKNECEEMLGDIESAIRQPTASVDELIAVVQNVSSPSSPTDDPPVLAGALSEQLKRVAESHGGRVPLHGRLFAQWMHYAYPRECPFPHKTGSFEQHTLTPGAYGKGYIASKNEMREHSSASSLDLADGKEEDWMSKWSDEEEMPFDSSVKMVAPWEGKGGLFCSFFIFVVVAGMAAMGVIGTNKGSAKGGSALPTFTSKHSHFV